VHEDSGSVAAGRSARAYNRVPAFSSLRRLPVMSESRIEDLVARFLERREAEPGLDPAVFAAEEAPDCRDRLLRAIDGALEVSRLLPDDAFAGAVPGGTVGPYALVREIGRGGMGIVFEAERDGERCALKWLPQAPLLGPRAMERLRREAAALARLAHENVVRIRETGSHAGVPYLVMDLVRGEPLSASIGRLDPAEAARVVRSLALAVETVHEHGVTHRDLKPQNVMMRPDGEPVLIDFGLVAADDLPSLTSTGDLLGTPRYMAPEQVRGLPADARTDVHALGMILYELATGRPVHAEDTREKILEAVSSGAIVRPRRARAGFPGELEKIVMTALALDPRRRFSSAAAMAEDLGRFLAGERVLARPPGPVARLAMRVRRRPARAALVVATALLLVAVVFAVRESGRSARAAEEARFVESRLGESIVAWLDGDAAALEAPLGEAIGRDPGHPVGAALAALAREAPLDPRAREPAAALLDGLRLLEAGDAKGAVPRLREAAAALPDDALPSALLGIAATRMQDEITSIRELQVAARKLPASRRIARDLAAALRRAGQMEASEREYRRALDLDPSSASLWTEFAQLLLQCESIDRGIEAAREAVRLAGPDDPDAVTVLAGLLDGKGERAEARSLLRRLIDSHPSHVLARLRLAFSLDMDHLVVEARDAYREVIDVSPRNAMALTCIANLHAGADRGKCRGCDEGYAGHEEMIDLELAGEYLLRALDADRGRSSTLHNTMLQVALKLEERGPIMARLEELTAGADKTQPTLRLEFMLRRIRLAEGE